MGASIITAERARHLLSYDPDAGELRWRVAFRTFAVGQRAGCLHAAGYWRVGLDGRKYSLHRIVWLIVTGDWPAGDVDHINGLTSDNRWANLRDVPHSVNSQNKRSAHRGKKGSLPLGVMKRDRALKKPYYASIADGQTRRNLGYFSTAEAAHEAYLQAKRVLHEGNTL